VILLFGHAEGQPLRRSMSGGSSLAAAAAEDELTLLRIDADNTLLLDALERRAPRSVRNTVSYLEVRRVLQRECTHAVRLLSCEGCASTEWVVALVAARACVEFFRLRQLHTNVHQDEVGTDVAHRRRQHAAAGCTGAVGTAVCV
jgi:hypothetical protein